MIFQVRTQLSLTKLLDAICSSLIHKENWEEVCGDLHAVRIIGQTGGFPKTSKENLKRSLQCVLQKSKDFEIEGKINHHWQVKLLISESFTEESPPKKRKIDSNVVQPNNASPVPEEKAETEPPMSSEEKKEEEIATESKEEPKSENEEMKDAEKPATASTAPSASTSILTTSRNDLIKDIESHIEIIYECLDELNDAGLGSSLNKTTSSEATPPTSETPSQDTEKAVKEAAENDGETAAHNESKNE